MLAWYSYPASDELKKMFAGKEYSLQHFLRKTGAGKYIPADIRAMHSVDTMEEYQRIKKELVEKELQEISQRFTTE